MLEVIVESADSDIAKTVIETTKLEEITELIEYSEDNVGFGDANSIIVVGLTFIWESVLSGITWDILKAQIESALGNLSKKQLEKTSVYLAETRNGERTLLEISTSADNKVHLKTPAGFELEIWKNDR